MAIQTPSCNDSQWQLLFKILQSLPDISTGGGGGSIIVQDEGIVLTNSVAQFNFVGAGVTATAVGNNVTVTIPAGGGTGDVVGPAVAVNNDIVTFDGVTGKLIKDSGVAISSLITSANLQSGVQAIGSGATSVAVVFPTAFSAAPHVVATIGHPTGEANNLVDILTDTVTTLGFTGRFTGATGSANYKMYWMAHI